MFTDEAGGTRPVGRDRRGFLKELGLGGIARERRLSGRRLGTAHWPAGSGDLVRGSGGFLAAGWERRAAILVRYADDFAGFQRRADAKRFLRDLGELSCGAGLRGRSGQSPLLSRTFLPFRL